MIKKTAVFQDHLREFADTTTTIKANAILLQNALKSDKVHKDATVGGVVITAHAKWLEDKNKEFIKASQDFDDTYSKLLKAAVELRSEIPKIVKACEEYLKELDDLKEMLVKYEYDKKGGNYIKSVNALKKSSYDIIVAQTKGMKEQKAHILKEAEG
jgi:hypothetical protein